MNEITAAWKETNLLDGLNSESADELARTLEEMTVYLISSFSTSDFPPAENVIFPIIRRIYDGVNRPGKFFLIVNCVDLFWDVNEKWEKFKLDYSDVFANIHIDAEAEFVYIYCINYVKDLKKRGII